MGFFHMKGRGEGGTYSCASGPNAVKHVCSESNGDDQVFWVALFIKIFVSNSVVQEIGDGGYSELTHNSHDISRLIIR